MHNQGAHRPYAQGLVLADSLAILLISWPAAVVVLTSGGFWFGIPITAYHLWIGLILSLGGVLVVRPNARTLCHTLTICALVALTTSYVAGQLHDLSFDGQVYHMPAVIALAKGWNPFLSITLAQWDPEFAGLAGAGIYIEHYAKGAWFVAAAVYKATGSIESGKAVNLILMVAAFVVAWSALQRLGVRGNWSTALAGGIALNPIAICQASTFYVDGQVASLFTICLILSIDYLREPRRWVLALLACAFLSLMEVKFTGLVYAILIVVGLTASAWLAGKRQAATRFALALFCLGLVAVSAFGYQPYLTNTIHHGHPFYPAVGQEGGRNVQWKQAPSEFIAMNRVAKLGISVFSKSTNGHWEWKWPMSIHKAELLALTGADTRYGGLGPWYSGALVMALILAFYMARVLVATEFKAGAFLLAVLALTILINPEAWWARLSPQLWLLPFVPVVAALRNPLGWRPWLGRLVLTAMLANSLMVGLYSGKYAMARSADLVALIERLRAASQAEPIEIALSDGFQITTMQRLAQSGVRYRRVDAPDCQPAHGFTHMLKACALHSPQ